jgi:hypothetical protein
MQFGTIEKRPAKTDAGPDIDIGRGKAVARDYIAPRLPSARLGGD